mmetsp:Transcript_9668/g.16692  ORF Transcript_9668/g.16692 Transcript_9668/m.16692 type:complete len:200 (-) Transcript_9668:1591-2190(-)
MPSTNKSRSSWITFKPNKYRASVKRSKWLNKNWSCSMPPTTVSGATTEQHASYAALKRRDMSSHNARVFMVGRSIRKLPWISPPRPADQPRVPIMSHPLDGIRSFIYVHGFRSQTWSRSNKKTWIPRLRSSFTSNVLLNMNDQYPAILYSFPFPSAPASCAKYCTWLRGRPSSPFTASLSLVTSKIKPGGQYSAMRILQ